MAKIPCQNIDEYIALQPPKAQIALERVRRAIAKAVPGAEECISYSIPAFRYNGRVLLYFAGWKEHYSIYPAADAMVEAFDGKLDQYRASKGTLHFPLAKPAPAELIARIAKFRMQEMDTRNPKPVRKSAAKPRRRGA